MQTAEAERVRVLVVEDDDEDFILAREYLSDAQRLVFDIRRCTTLDEALSVIAAGGIDVCLIDYLLGATTGLELFEAARQDGFDVPMVLLTGTGDSDLADRALRAGISDFLEKARIDGPALERSIMYVLERRKQQVSIMRLNQELEERVQQRTEALQSINRELESFCYSVSHDLRAPLRAIVSTSSILLEDHAAKLDSEAQTLLQSQIHSGVRLGTLIDDLLTFIRLRQAVPRRTKIDVTQMVGEVAKEIGNRELSLNVQPGMSIEADPGMVRTILQNFIDNAVKFTSPGRSLQIEVSQTPDGAISVRDNGIGFDMKYVHKLFLPFERLHRADEYPGNGIGLASVKRYVDLHGGRVWAEGVIGKGSTFSFQV